MARWNDSWAKVSRPVRQAASAKSRWACSSSGAKSTAREASCKDSSGESAPKSAGRGWRGPPRVAAGRPQADRPPPRRERNPRCARRQTPDRSSPERPIHPSCVRWGRHSCLPLVFCLWCGIFSGRQECLPHRAENALTPGPSPKGRGEIFKTRAEKCTPASYFSSSPRRRPHRHSIEYSCAEGLPCQRPAPLLLRRFF